MTDPHSLYPGEIYESAVAKMENIDTLKSEISKLRRELEDNRQDLKYFEAWNSEFEGLITALHTQADFMEQALDQIIKRKANSVTQANLREIARHALAVWHVFKEQLANRYGGTKNAPR